MVYTLCLKVYIDIYFDLFEFSAEGTLGFCGRPISLSPLLSLSLYIYIFNHLPFSPVKYEPYPPHFSKTSSDTILHLQCHRRHRLRHRSGNETPANRARTILFYATAAETKPLFLSLLFGSLLFPGPGFCRQSSEARFSENGWPSKTFWPPLANRFRSLWPDQIAPSISVIVFLLFLPARKKRPSLFSFFSSFFLFC